MKVIAIKILLGAGQDLDNLVRSPLNFQSLVREDSDDNQIQVLSNDDNFSFIIEKAAEGSNLQNCITGVDFAVQNSTEFDHFEKSLIQNNVKYEKSSKLLKFQSIISHIQHRVILSENDDDLDNNFNIIDHLAFCTNEENYDKLISWYQNLFELKKSVKVKMAYENFQMDLTLGFTGDENHENQNIEETLETPVTNLNLKTQFVFAKSSSKKSDQISDFLNTLGKSMGLQHIAFNLEYFIKKGQNSNSSDLIFIENFLKSIEHSNQLTLNKAPKNYYDLIQNQFSNEILSSKNKNENDKKLQDQMLETAKNCQLLLDYDVEKDGYLLQAFSKPLFGAGTLFFEFIYRYRNKYGLGPRNVENLWRSLQEK